MGKKEKIFIILLMMIIVGFSGCTENNNGKNNNSSDFDSFIGSWSGTGIKYFDFSTDNTCVYTGITYDWSLKDNQLILLSDNGVKVTYDYSFSSDHNTLTLVDISNDETNVFTRE